MLEFLKRKININIKEKKSIFDEWATTKNAEGFISIIDRLPNPDVVLRKTGKNISVLRQLISHHQVGTCIDSRKAGTKSQDYSLLDNYTPKNHLDLYKEIFEYIDIDKLIDDILEAPMYGYAPIEIKWEKSGSYIVPVKAEGKPQEWYFFNSDGQFFFKDRRFNGKREIDLNGFKYLLPRNKATFLNPYGDAALSRCFWNVAFSNGGMEFWGKFTEKYGMPFMMGKYDRSMTDNEKKDFLQSLINMVQAAVAVIPSDGSVEMMQTGSTGNAEIYEKLIDKCENNISKVILGQTLTTDVGKVGSYAASQTHACVRADIVNSDKKLVKKTINQLLQIINIVNFGDENCPKFDFEKEDSRLEQAEVDTKVHALGVNFSEDYITRTYGYQEGDVKVREENIGFNFEEKRENTPPPSPLPQGAGELSTLDNLEKLTDLKEIQESINPSLEQVIEFFNKTKDFDETENKLAELYPKMNTKELEEILTKVIFISDLMGRTGVYNEEKK